MQSTYYDQNELSELNQKINNRFIRNVYKPPKRTRLLHSSEIIPQHEEQVLRPFVMQQQQTPQYETFQQFDNRIMATPSPFYHQEPDCRNVADHTTNCPVCCKLYKSYNVIYITIIAILIIIIMFLLKKIFSNNK